MDRRRSRGEAGRRACHAPGSVCLLAAALVLAVAGPARAHDVQRPEIVDAPAAPWPEGMTAEHDVVVPVALEIGADGTVEAVELEARVHPALDAAAEATARTFRFRPAMRDGAPVPARVRAVVRFTGVRHAEAHAHAVAHAQGAPHPHPHPEPGAGVPAHAHAPGASTDHRHPEQPPPPVDPPVDVRVQGAARLRSSDTLVARDVLEAAPQPSGSDLLRTVPGVAITQHGGQGKAHQIFFRGFDAEHGQDVEIWVAGAPVNEVSNIHGQGYADLHFVIAEVVRQLRAKPGTYDPRQGEFAVAGSLHLDLGVAEEGVEVAGTLGSFGERRVFASFRPAGAPEETFAAFQIQGTDGFGPSRASERGTAMAQMVVDAGATSRIRLFASAHGGHFDSAGVLPLALARTRGDARFRTLDPDQGGDSTRVQLVVDLEGHDDVGGDYVVAPFFVHRTLRLRQNFTGYLVDPIQGDGTEQINDSTTFGVNAHLEKAIHLLGDHDAIAAGVYGRTDLVDQSQTRLSSVNDAPTATLVDAGLTVLDVAAWTELTVRPLDRVTLRAGVRVDGIHGEATDRASSDAGGELARGARRGGFGVHVGPKASVEVGALPWLRPFASYGEGFRGRQVRSLANGEDAPFVEVRSGEVGARLGVDRLMATVAAFRTGLDGDLVFDPELARNEPVGPTARTGVALELALRPAPWMVHATSATFVHAAFTEDDEDHAAGDLVPYAPQVVARSDLSLVPTVARVLERDLSVRVGLGLSYLALRPLPFGELGHDIFTADASAGARLGEVEVRLDATNLLDAAYYDGEFVYASQFQQGATESLVPQRHVTVGPPRAFFATVALHL